MPATARPDARAAARQQLVRLLVERIMRTEFGFPAPTSAHAAERVELQDQHARMPFKQRQRMEFQQRSPAWRDQAAINRIYREAHILTCATGILHHVDHVIPLRGDLVSGLHVHQNLRVIRAGENILKGNDFEP